MAVGNVSATITIKGQDQASAAINKASASAKALAANLDAAAKKGEKANASFSHGLPGLQGKHDSFTRLSAAAAGAGGAMAESVHGIALVDAAMRLLPGPIGAAVAVIGALAGATVLVSKHMSETSAKMRLLGTAATEDLAKGLELSTDEAIKLSQALTQLPNGISPSIDLMNRVRANAESMGLEGADAVIALTEALAKGGDAAANFSAKFGDIGGTAGTEQTAQLLGLSTELLGISKARTAESIKQEEAAAALKRIQALRLEQHEQEKQLAHAIGTDAENRGKFAGMLAALDTKAATDRVAGLGARIAAEADVLREMQDQTAEQQKQIENTKAQSALLSSRTTLLEAQAKLLTGDAAASLRLEATTINQLDATRKLNAFDRDHRGALTDSVQAERNILQSKVLQAQASGEAIRSEQRTEAARKKADASRNAQRSKADAQRKIEAADRKQEAIDRAFMAGIELAPEFDNKLIAERLKLKSEEDKSLRSNAQAVEAHRDRVLGVYASIEADPARRALIEQQQIEIQLAKDLMAVKLDQAISDGQRATESAALQVAANQQIKDSIDRVTEAQNAQIQAQIATASTAASAVKTLVGVFAGEEVAKRAAAGVDAAIETARAIASFAAYDYVGGAMHAASAIAFGKVALTSPTVPSAGGSGPSQAKPAAESNGGGGGTTVINLHGIMTTKAEVGAAIGKALASAKPTGMVPA